MSESQSSHIKKPSLQLWVALAMPLLLAAIIFAFSPNFQTVQTERANPFGGDFLQEWVGGHVVGTEPEKLYDLDHVKSVQHDPEAVGFEWPEGKYFPMVYPPFFYAAMWPFSQLSFPMAARLWLLFSAIAVTCSGYLLFRFYPRCRCILGVCLFACIVFTPLLYSFSMGQKSTILLLILTTTFLLLHHQRPFASGLMFGLIAFKPHLGILIGLTMLLKRQWSFAVGSLLMVGVLVGVSWAFQPNWWPDYLHVVSNMGDYVQTGGYQLADSHSLWGSMQLTLGFLSPNLVKVVAALLSALVLYLLWKIVSPNVETCSSRFAVQFSAMTVATVMLSPHFYTYDLTILLLPMLLIVSSYDEGTWRKNSKDQAIGFILLALFALTGLFGRIAGVIQIQPSIVLMLALLVLLGINRGSADAKPNAS